MRNQPQVVQIDGAALQAEAEKSHEFKTLAHYGAQRDRNREVTDVEQMRKGLIEKHQEELDADKWLEAFHTLEDLGMGSLIHGRNGTPTRFRWNYSLKAIGAAALSGEALTVYRITPKQKGGRVINDYSNSRPTLVDVKVNHRPVKDKPVTSTRTVEVATRAVRSLSEPVRATPKDTKSAATLSTHHIYIALRPDYTFEAELPKLSQKEADILCAAIRRCAK